MPIRIIAEIGVNHNGSIDMACELIRNAKGCGADIAKFQTFSADRLAAWNTPKVPYQLRTSDPEESHYDMLKKLELSREDHGELNRYCEKLGIEFCSTPYSREDAEFLYELGVRTFKVASADIVDRTLHEFLASTGCECIVATGMATLDEIAATLDIYERNGSREKVILLQCVSAYPAELADVNLRAMNLLRERFQVRVGFSDHTRGCACAVAAAALGAEVIEKHFTLDPSLPGPDHAASVTPVELTELVQSIRAVELALGDGVKRICSAEEAMRGVSRKSIVAARDLMAGEVISMADLAFRRPGTGLSPMRYPELVGLQLRVSLRAGEPLQREHLR
ncbi:MAG TPA: N-acetylneuraminate synthase [Verrucomicrobia bacterium]|nr:MAG: hypothetical protein A2X46_08715 [Lentisphaerae bacterium GWF2_57_35]HBA82754.1 N-acetylneuraminate synthase [Verrucomicrobiota bacterium]